MEKTELLQKMRQSRAGFEALIAQFSEEQMLLPVLPGGWTVKDALAHIAWWSRRALQVTTAVINGQQPEYSLEESDVDGINLKVYAENLTRALAEVRKDESDSYRSLLDMTESLDAAMLDDPQRFVWTKGAPLSVVIEWNTFGHYEEHIEDFRRALAV